ncbi:hypothetical protein [Haladaptatus sp. GCM10025893]|uniref:hypothetical protein n=1 Tax=Haladaptatus sp. GCM10025893 TaxID=3252659 RepID=UPI003624340F
MVDQIVQWRASDDASLAGWAAHQAAVEGFDADPLYEISLPTLVAHGTADEVWPAAGVNTSPTDCRTRPTATSMGPDTSVTLNNHVS